MDANMKTIGYAIPAEDIKRARRDLKAAGYEVDYSRSAGTMTVKLDGLVIARAMSLAGPFWCLRAVPGLFNAEPEKPA